MAVGQGEIDAKDFSKVFGMHVNWKEMPFTEKTERELYWSWGDTGFSLDTVGFSVFLSNASGAQHMVQDFQGKIWARAAYVESLDVQKVMEALDVSNNA